MSITACLKVVFGEGQPKIIWTDQIGEYQYPSADVQNLAVFALLGGFFLSSEEGLPTSTDIKGLSGKYLGLKEDGYSTDGHPEGSVSLVGFTGESIKNFLVSLYNLFGTEETEILSSSLSELNDTLIRNGLTELTFHNSKTVITIQRCSQQEISNLEQENPDFGEFVDAFDMVYQTLPNIVEVLEDSGFEVAKYKTNPDEILFKSECFLEENVGLGGGGGTEECTPTTLPIIYKEGVNEPTGELYGRYRINGGDWVDYTVLADYYLVNNFLGETGVMDRQGGSQITPFQFEMGYRERLIKGASAQEPYADGQDGVFSIEHTTVDFQITDGGANDLVQLLFGGDASVSSCAVGSWYGV